MKVIVKRGGHNEEYDIRKLYASVYAACLSVREHPGSAELIAEEVVKDVEQWLNHRHEVTSNDLRRQAAKHLTAINPDAGHIYKHHRVIW